MTREVTVAAAQLACSWALERNLDAAEALVREAAAAGADVVLLPVSFFERAGAACFNSLAMIDADGEVLGVYRKAHIPADERACFSPGDTGFKVFATRHGRLGAGICWDQWFPEAARCMALDGAELLLYSTAMGTTMGTAMGGPPSGGQTAGQARRHWRNALCGHAAANMVPLAAANRVGTEQGGAASPAVAYWSGSFVCDQTGTRVAQCGRAGAAVVTAAFDLDALAAQRAARGLRPGRRPELYGALSGLAAPGTAAGAG